MLSAAYDAIKARAPERAGRVRRRRAPRRARWIDRVLATAGADAARKFDVANVHLRLRAAATCCPTSPSSWPAGARCSRGHGFAGPIWVTEHGYPADPAFQRDPAYRGAADRAARRQAAFLARLDPAASPRPAPTRSS